MLLQDVPDEFESLERHPAVVVESGRPVHGHVRAQKAGQRVAVTLGRGIHRGEIRGQEVQPGVLSLSSIRPMYDFPCHWKH